MYDLIDKLRRERTLTAAQYALLLDHADDALLDYAARAAREVAREHFGRGVFIRGLIEVTSYCRNDCYYCGLRRSNTDIARYRLSEEQIMECCALGYRLGFRTFVLQGGEDAGLKNDTVERIVRSIKTHYPDCAITLSLGERSRDAYARWRAAGADRYLLRHEAADAGYYAQLHPAKMLHKNRMDCLQALRDLGYQTGPGMMVGPPGQTVDHLVKDITFIERFRPQMVGIGPYIAQHDTPFAGSPPGSVERTLLLLSIFRLMLPRALIPSTTALASLDPQGREKGILAGANVVMPNLSPEDMREMYAIYDNKRSTGAESAEGLQPLERQLAAIGYHIEYGRGDYPATEKE